VLMFPLLLQTIISNQIRPRRLKGAWFSRLFRHHARRRSGSILTPEPTRDNKKDEKMTQKGMLTVYHYILRSHLDVIQC